MPTATASTSASATARSSGATRRSSRRRRRRPSDPALRRRLGDAALTLARAVGYVSAGTCEFLVDDRGEPAFLEMNTRLQVEHPVTELVTGRDLVADQLRIAAGEPLGFEQRRRPTGHAVEVRLYAEDAEDGFLPATGRVEALRWPAGDGIRVDAGIELGTEIGGRFDPMLAKVVAWGPDRATALDRLDAAPSTRRSSSASSRTCGSCAGSSASRSSAPARRGRTRSTGSGRRTTGRTAPRSRPRRGRRPRRP